MTKRNLLIAPLAVFTLLTSCQGGKATFGVFLNCNEATISKATAVKGEDFVAEIIIKHEVLATGGFALPATPEKVESGNRELLDGEYTYTLKKDETKADIAIP